MRKRQSDWERASYEWYVGRVQWYLDAAAAAARRCAMFAPTEQERRYFEALPLSIQVIELPAAPSTGDEAP